MVSNPTITRYLSLPVTHCGGSGSSLGQSELGSGLGLQQFEEQFVHGHTAVLFDAAEVLDSASGRLTEEREGHD